MARKSLGSSSIKRDRSASSDLSDAPVANGHPPVAAVAVNVTPGRLGRASKAASAAKTAAVVKIEESEGEVEDEKPKAKKPRASKGKTVVSAPEDEGVDAEVEKPARKGKGKAKAAPKVANGEAVAQTGEEGDDAEEKPKRKPKAKAFPPPDLDPSTHPTRLGHPVFQLPSLTVPPNGGIGDPALNSQRPMLLGAHVSIGGGPATALLRAGKAGANGLAMFVKSQRQWKSNPYEEEAIERFRALLKPQSDGGMGYGPETVLVHGSYLINLGNPDTIKWQQAYECFVDDLQRCRQLGLRLYNWHPGSTVGQCTKEESYASIAKAINLAHKVVPDVIPVIENMANAGSNIVGTTFEDLAGIIALVEDKSRVRVCLDTCHLFAAGFDIRTPESYRDVMRRFNEVVGNGYLAGIHLNDSKAGLGMKKDLHENIGLGEIGLSAFRQIMRDPLMAGIPICLETPAADNPLDVGELAIWKKEIAMLYRIQSIEDDEWITKEAEIAAEWRKERDVMNPPKEKTKGGGKKKKGKKGADSDEDEEE